MTHEEWEPGALEERIDAYPSDTPALWRRVGPCPPELARALLGFARARLELAKWELEAEWEYFSPLAASWEARLRTAEEVLDRGWVVATWQ